MLQRLIAALLIPLAAACTAPAGPSAGSAAADSAPPSEPAGPPNILLIFADDQRADTIGALGNAHIRTPHLDSLVERGTTFERAYCQGGPHGAVCIPSRAMLMTGRSWFQLNLNTLDERTTLPEHLAGVGYDTFMSGKWHNGHDALRRAFPDARAVLRGGMSNHYDVPLVDITDGAFHDVRRGEGHSSEIFSQAAIDFLSGLDEDGDPFFCYLAFTAPHDPRDAPPELLEELRTRRPPLPANYLPQHPFDNSQLTTRDERLGAWPRTEDLVREQLAEYYAIIEHMDAQIGRVFEALEATGRADNTVVLFAADHGLAVGSHGLLGKQNVYEHSMRAPMIVAGPGVAHGRTDALVHLHDLYATALDLAGTEPEPDTHSISLRPFLAGVPAEPIRDTVLTSQHHMRAVTDGRWKLIRYADIAHTQLFDLEADPEEVRNLEVFRSNREYTAQVQRLTTELQRLQSELGDSLPWTSPELRPGAIDLYGRPRQPDQWQPEWIVEKYFAD